VKSFRFLRFLGNGKEFSGEMFCFAYQIFKIIEFLPIISQLLKFFLLLIQHLLYFFFSKTQKWILF